MSLQLRHSNMRIARTTWCARREAFHEMPAPFTRYEEFVCVICEALGWEVANVSRRGTYYSDTPTNQHQKKAPADFLKVVGGV